MVLVAMAIMVRPMTALAAPYAAMVIDARTGKVLHSRNADTQLHPASLTKMMTLYLTFQAIEHGDISLDTMVTISANAAAEPPSKLGLRAGQRIKLRYLIRAAAIKSANDAATALAEAVGGSEAAFVARMNRMARAMGMNRTTFKNANGLTRPGHLSTARDMTTLGRHLLYDFPQYYNLFSRRSADAGVRTVNNTNRRFLNAYRGADGIKTGYTAAAGFNLVASARRGNERIIATLFGGKSTASRNAKVADLLDLGFRRAPSNVSLRLPPKPPYFGAGSSPQTAPGNRPAAGRTIRLVTAVSRSPRPVPRPGPEPAPVPEPSETLLAAIDTAVDSGVADSVEQTTDAAPVAVALNLPNTPPPPRDFTGMDIGLNTGADTGTGADPAQAQTATAEAEAPLTAPTDSEPPAEQAVAEAPVPEAPVPEASVPEASVPDGPPAIAPAPRPAEIVLVAAVRAAPSRPSDEPEIVTHISSSGGGAWGIDIGVYNTRFDAERILLKTALAELATLGGALRKPASRADGWHANFVGMSEAAAELACRRLQARATSCTVIGPG